MFCPDINGGCKEEECLDWNKELNDCLRRLSLLKELGILPREMVMKITEIKKKNQNLF